MWVLSDGDMLSEGEAARWRMGLHDLTSHSASAPHTLTWRSSSFSVIWRHPGVGHRILKAASLVLHFLLSAALHGSCQALSPDPLMAVSGVKVAISTRQLPMASEPILPASCLLAPIKWAFICLLLGLGLFPLIMGLPLPQASSRCFRCRAHPLGCRKRRRTGESLLSLLFEENAEPFCSGLQTLW